MTAYAGRRVWTEQDIRALGATTDLVTAGAILGIGRTRAHQLARAGKFPVPVLRLGRAYTVPTAPIRALLSIDLATPLPADRAGGDLGSDGPPATSLDNP
jgi:hypothetical protein